MPGLISSSNNYVTHGDPFGDNNTRDAMNALGNQTVGSIEQRPATELQEHHTQIGSDSLVENRLTGLLSQNNPYMQQATAVGNEQSNSRGLLNSTMGVQAAESARIAAAMPIAQQDASLYGQANLQDSAFIQQGLINNQNYGNNWNLNDQQYQQQGQLNQQNAANQLINTTAAQDQLFGHNTQLADQAYGHNQGLQQQQFGFNTQLADQAFGHNTQLNNQTFGHNTQLANQAYGHNMGLQNDAQSHQTGMANQAFSHNTALNNQQNSHAASMQGSAQSHATTMQGQNMAGTLQVNTQAQIGSILNNPNLSHQQQQDAINTLTNSQNAQMGVMQANGSLANAGYIYPSPPPPSYNASGNNRPISGTMAQQGPPLSEPKPADIPGATWVRQNGRWVAAWD